MIAVDYLGAGRIPEDGQRFWEHVPFDILKGFAMLLAISILMHLLFRERVQSLTGKRFWLFPFTSLTVAALIFSSVVVLGSFAEQIRFGGGRPQQWIMTPIYWWIGSLVVVFFHIWVTYPLAIINQLIIRKVYGIPRG